MKEKEIIKPSKKAHMTEKNTDIIGEPSTLSQPSATRLMDDWIENSWQLREGRQVSMICQPNLTTYNWRPVE